MSLLLETTVKISLVILFALAATGLLRSRSAAMRHWVLAAALLAAAAVPVLGLVVPAWHMSLRLPAAISEATDGRQRLATRQPQSAAVVAQEAARVAAAGAVDRVTSPRTISAGSLVASVWLFGVAISLLVLFVGLARLSWLASRSVPIRHGRWADMAGTLSREYGLPRPVLLLESMHPTLLVTWGLLQPKVLLPCAARGWTDERIRVVLSHELAHIRRRDWIVQMTVQFLLSVYWFNPLLWIASTRLRQESEQACDDAVLRLGVEGSAYATHLLELARAFRNERRMWSPAPAIVRTSSLERRVSAMLNGRVNRDPVSRSASLAAAIALLAITLPIAGFGASAQTFSTLSGSVIDPQGALLPGVTLVLTNTQSQAKHEVRSNVTGQFEFVGLPNGDFMLEARLPGFMNVTEPVTVNGRNVQRDLAMQVGTLEETISVVGGPPSPARLRDPALGERARQAFQRDLEQCSASAASAGPRVGGKIRPPRKVVNVAPLYPEGLRLAKIGGIVNMKALIGTDGRVKDVQPVTSPTIDPGLVSAAIDAVNQWEFDGTLLNCVPVEVSMMVSVSFSPER